MSRRPGDFFTVSFLRPFLFAAGAAGLIASAAGAAPLTVDEAIRLALDRNRDIKVESFSRGIARANLLMAYGQFDPSLNFTRNYGESGNSLSTDPQLASQLELVKIDKYALSLDGLTPWGLNYSLGATAQNQRGTYNNFINNYATFGGLSVTQPLLRGFGFGNNLNGVRVARADRGIADWQFRQAVIDTITGVVNAFSDLEFAHKELEISRRSRELAAGLVAENEKRFKVGGMSESDVTQARARTATREEAIIFSEQAVRDAENALRRLIGEDIVLPQAEPLAIEPAAAVEPMVQPAEDLKKAYQLRPDYQAARLGIDIRRANESLAKNQLLPRLDFVGSYGYSGLDPNFERSRQMVSRQDNRAYTVGMVVSVPLTFAQGRGKVRAARLQRQQAETDLGRLEQDIAVSVAHAAGEIETTRRRVEANRSAYQLAQQALENEIKKLRAGTSNTFFVLNLQENVAGAESSLYNALAGQRRAAAGYDRELGTTLTRYNVTLTKN